MITEVPMLQQESDHRAGSRSRGPLTARPSVLSGAGSAMPTEIDPAGAGWAALRLLAGVAI